MPEARSLVIQSVLFGNSAGDIVSAAIASANSVAHAREAGLVLDWQLALGDSSPTAVLDAGALDEIRAAVERAGGTLRYTVFGANLGSAGGHNALAEPGSSDLMLILNPDARMAPDTVTVLARALVTGVGITEARQIPLEHPKDFVRGAGDTSWASTACALTSRDAFDEVGGFDADTFFLYCDDVDYSWRLRLAGYRVLFVPAARVFHDKRLTTTADWPASAAEIYYTDEAALLLAYKYSRPRLVRSLLAKYRRTPSDVHSKVLAEYETRRRTGRLPARIDPGHRVGNFTKDKYAQHRF